MAGERMTRSQNLRTLSEKAFKPKSSEALILLAANGAYLKGSGTQMG
jgi:hypothetical protein